MLSPARSREFRLLEAPYIHSAKDLLSRGASTSRLPAVVARAPFDGHWPTSRAFEVRARAARTVGR
jgi:hypothetical protein